MQLLDQLRKAIGIYRSETKGRRNGARSPHDRDGGQTPCIGGVLCSAIPALVVSCQTFPVILESKRGVADAATRKQLSEGRARSSLYSALGRGYIVLVAIGCLIHFCVCTRLVDWQFIASLRWIGPRLLYVRP